MTSVFESNACDEAEGSPTAGRAYPARRPHEAGREDRHCAAGVRIEQFHTSDAVTARRFFANAYVPGWRLTGLATGSAVSHRRCQARAMTLDEVVIEGRVRCEVPAADAVVVIQPCAGWLSVSDGPLQTADCPVLVAHGMSCVLNLNAARFGVVSIAPDVLHKAAADRRVPLPQQIQFLSGQPRSAAAVRAWHRALDYVSATLACADTAQQPMIAAAAAPLLATVLLECYPSNVTAEQDLLSDPAVPEALKDAVSFIHRHVAGDVGVNEIADAVHLTPRAVQYLFRQRLDTTPTEYVRRVRLHRAHQDLRSADYASATVTEIAQRWGFAHTGRFAVLYRQTYGRSPHTTLRQ
jgi:AraC-like DNA-binding protein